MKRSLFVLFGTLLLAACGSTQQSDKIVQEETPEVEEVTNGNTEEHSSERAVLPESEIFEETEELGDVVTSSESSNKDNLKELPEFDALSNNIDLTNYTNIVKTDHKGNRVILFTNEQGHKQYKSVFIKYKSRLKIVDLPNDNLIFNDVIQATEQKESASSDSNKANNDAIKNLPEFNIIAQHIDLDTYSGTIQTDHKGNRVLTFADANGHKKYKSIFVKRDNRLKIIHFDNDDLIFNDII